jgi:hypothetical protein
MEWALHSDEAKEVDYVLYIDADMLLRTPLDPVKMGVKRCASHLVPHHLLTPNSLFPS